MTLQKPRRYAGSQGKGGLQKLKLEWTTKARNIIKIREGLRLRRPRAQMSLGAPRLGHKTSIAGLVMGL
jgi:hypothetical protein